MADLCTVDDVKDYLSMTGADAARDALLSTLVSRASDIIRAYTGQPFTGGVETRAYDLEPSGTYYTGPVTAVTAVTVNGQTLDSSQYWVYGEYVRTLPPDASKFSSWSTDLYRAVSITATYGATYDAATNTVPGALRHIATITAARLYKMRDAGFTTRIGTTDLGTAEYVDLWTAQERRVLDVYKGRGAAVLA